MCATCEVLSKYLLKENTHKTVLNSPLQLFYYYAKKIFFSCEITIVHQQSCSNHSNFFFYLSARCLEGNYV